MIQYALLVALGFFLASIIFILVAPSFWNRAVRLTRKRIEETLPVSLSEIEADKDQLRAAFAVKIRRLEAALAKTREKSAHQLVEISRLQMMMTGLRDQIAALERSLDERRNAASVFELTIKRRFPELEAALAAAEALVEKRSYEVSDLTSKMKRREEVLLQMQRSAALQQAELTRLREAMEKSGAERSGRFKKRPSQWSIDEYRSEYDRLNVELSKLREQLSLAYDREANQISFLKAELQQLGEQILASATPAPPPATADARASMGETPSAAGKTQRPFIYRAPPRRPAQDTPRPQPRPWVAHESEAEVEPLDKSEAIAAFSGKRRGVAASDWDEFAGKSLEEALEAALPISGQTVETGAPDSRQAEAEVRAETTTATGRALPRRIAAPIREPIVKRPASGEGRAQMPPSPARIPSEEQRPERAPALESGTSEARTAPSGDEPSSSAVLNALDIAPADDRPVFDITVPAARGADPPLSAQSTEDTTREETAPTGNWAFGAEELHQPAAAAAAAVAAVEPIRPVPGDADDEDETPRKRSLLDRLRGVNGKTVS